MGDSPLRISILLNLKNSKGFTLIHSDGNRPTVFRSIASDISKHSDHRYLILEAILSELLRNGYHPLESDFERNDFKNLIC